MTTRDIKGEHIGAVEHIIHEVEHVLQETEERVSHTAPLTIFCIIAVMGSFALAYRLISG